MAIPFTNDELNNDTVSLSLETIKSIDQSLTESAYLILEKLYTIPAIRQKDLSATLHSSPSSLSNQLSRINTISPPLIGCEQRGRDKFFYLTSEGKAYVCQEMKKRAERIKSFPPNLSSSIDDIQYNGVMIPSHVLNTALADSLRDYINLSPLFNFDKSELSIMCKIIDNAFSDLFPSVFSSTQLEVKTTIDPLTDAQYYAIYFSLSQIVHHCIKNKLSKKEIIEYMQSILYLSETHYALFYMAEKIDRVQAIKNASANF